MRRIALLSSMGSPGIREAMARTARVAGRYGVDAAVFRNSDEVNDYAPDCVLAFSVQDAKLTPFPTYGVLAPPVSQYTVTRRFLRNVLTYDACLIASGAVRRWVSDLAFGARKFSCPIARFAPTVQATAFDPPRGALRLAYVGATPDASIRPVLEALRRDEPVDLRGPRGTWDWLPGFRAGADVPHDGEALLAVYREAGIGLDLTRHDARDDGLPSRRLLEIVASSSMAIVVRDPWLERTFGDALFYVDEDGDTRQTVQQIRGHVAWIASHRGDAIERARAAHAIASDRFTMDRMFPALVELHGRVLVEKGYAPDPDPASERSLPSATYIMRTGGGRPMALVRRALDSMVAQHYPKLRVLFVLFRPMPELADLRREYPQLGIEAVEDYGGLRSTAIVAGMRHVTTDYFGLLDDDDVLSPNHVRMLVKALQYHSGRNWRGRVRMAYSGSVEVGESRPRAEHAEYEDAFAVPRRERRVMEHYRLYSSTEMSQHRWYLINSWLAARDLIDRELLDDPRIHTCEDLYVALQIAQRTHLAFSGEVTMNHCYRDASSTIVDASRHLPDTLRAAVRHFSRLLPTESGYSSRLMPLGRAGASGQPTGCAAIDLIGRLETPARQRRDCVVIEDGAAVVTQPLTLSPGVHRITVQVDDTADEVEFEVEVVCAGLPQPSTVVSRYELGTLGWAGSVRCADVHVVVHDDSAAPARIGVRTAAGSALTVRHLLLAPIDVPAPVPAREGAQVG